MPFEESRMSVAPEDVAEQLKLVQEKVSVLNDETLRLEDAQKDLRRENARLDLEIESKNKVIESLKSSEEAAKVAFDSISKDLDAKKLEFDQVRDAAAKAVAEKDEAAKLAADASTRLSQAVEAKRAAEDELSAKRSRLEIDTANFENRKKTVRDLIESI